MGAYSRGGTYSIILPLGWASYLRGMLVRGITVKVSLTLSKVLKTDKL